MEIVLFLIGCAVAVFILRKVSGTGGAEPPPPPPADWPAGATWPPPRTMTPGRFAGYTLFACVLVFVVFPVVAFLLVWFLLGL